MFIDVKIYEIVMYQPLSEFPIPMALLGASFPLNASDDLFLSLAHSSKISMVSASIALEN